MKCKTIPTLLLPDLVFFVKLNADNYWLCREITSVKGKKKGFGKCHAAAAATAHLPQAFCMMAEDREMLMLHVCLGQCIARWVNVFKTKKEEKKSNSPWASGLSAV